MSTSTPTDSIALEARHIAKNYGPVIALRDINLELRRGEVVGLIGDNGAGKSTLIKILTGYIQPTAGEILIDGTPTKLRSVSFARSMGIETVYQDLALIPQLSIYHNMFLNREETGPGPLLDNREMKQEAARYLSDMGVRIPSIDAAVANLSGGQRQAVAIARALYSKPKILLLDEPLAAMGVKEATMILDLLDDLKARRDVSMLIIDHNYVHIFEVADRILLLQHGEITLNKRTAETSIGELTDLVAAEYRRARKSA